MPILLETQYLPSIQYCSKFCSADTVVIEQHENYRKGTYRNRSHIASANGLLRLTIPLQKGKNQQQNIRTVRIAYNQPWQAQHWTSIQSAYGNSPFFEYYADEIKPFFETPYEFLFDFNSAILNQIFDLIGIESTYRLSSEFQKTIPQNWKDLRNAIHPNPQKQVDDPNFKIIPYSQVFQERLGFMPNLSVLDLLFCVGPQTLGMLEESFVGHEAH